MQRKGRKYLNSRTPNVFRRNLPRQQPSSFISVRDWPWRFRKTSANEGLTKTTRKKSCKVNLDCDEAQIIDHIFNELSVCENIDANEGRGSDAYETIDELGECGTSSSKQPEGQGTLQSNDEPVQVSFFDSDDTDYSDYNGNHGNDAGNEENTETALKPTEV